MPDQPIRLAVYDPAVMWVEWIIAPLALAGVALGFAALLRWSGVVRPAIAGGVLAGSLVGATVLGRTAPATFERWVSGGAAEREAMESLRSRQGADLTVLQATGVTGAALAELAARHAAERADALKRLEAARQRHRLGQRFAVVALSALLLFATFPRPRPVRAWGNSLFIAAWTLLTGVAIAGTAAVFALDASPLGALLLGAIYAMFGGGLAAAPRRDSADAIEATDAVANANSHTDAPARHAVPSGDAVIRDAALLMWVAAALAVLPAMPLWMKAIETDPGARQAMQSAAPIGMVLGVLLRFAPARLRVFAVATLAPAFLVALLALHLDAVSRSSLAPLVLAILVGGDARWLGLAGALRWLGRPWRSAWSGSAPFTDAGAGHLALTGLLAGAAWLDSTLLLAALGGAAMADLAWPLRARMAQLMSRAKEDEVD